MLILAWRNIWRNKRRSLITISSVFFAVFFSILMRGFHSGSWDNLLNSVLHSYTGYIQVHAKDFWNNQNFDYSMAANDTLFVKIKRTPNAKGLVPRLESFALASAGEKTKGVITVGIDPALENQFSNLKNKVTEGRYFNPDDSGIIVSQRLAKFLEISVNDTLVLLSQGYQGVSANGLFIVQGIVRLPSPELDNQTIFMPLRTAQNFYSAPERLSSIVVDLENQDKAHKTQKILRKTLNMQNYEVMLWNEMLVELYQQYITDEGGALIMLGLLYIIVGFGIFGTVLMMLAERKREIAIMIILGMQRIRMIQLLSTELIIICLLGIVAGFIGSLPILYYFQLHPIEMTGDIVKSYEAFGMEPIIPVSMKSGYMIQQVINIASIVVLVLIYPLYNIFRLNLTKGLRR